ncbi:MAG TPA: response regulator [Kofleriaceae bacterium]
MATDLDDESDVPVLEYGRDILVVDDNDPNLIAIEAALSPLQRKLVLARSGTEALQHLLQQDFALIILDVAMPGMDGFETARLVRSRARNRATPIIFVTGLAWQEDEILHAYTLGAVDFLVKPIRSEVLRAKAGVFIQLQDRTRELHDKGEELRKAQIRAHERELAMQRERFESEVLEHKNRQLADGDRRKDEFLAILAHELRNPLQPLQTAVELLAVEENKPVPPRVRSIIERQVQSIGRLVDDLLDVARFQTGKLDLRREPIDLGTLVEQAVSDSRPAAAARKHDVTVSGRGASPTVFGDPVRLIQVMSNLLSNSIKYTEVGGRISVEWGSKAEDGCAFIRVTDNGKGITPELLPRIFDMFVQERVTGSGAGGLGLGLGLAKRLVELHGGRMTATSPGPGMGATFEVKLPVADHATLQGYVPKTDETAPVPRALRAVVVDDAADLRELVSDLLRMKGHEVTAVEDGASAVRVIREQLPDVALIDIGLPEMDGYEVARKLRAELPDKKLRLIAMTGYGQAADKAAATAAGFDAHIVKPASADKIMRAIYGDKDTP